MAEFTIPLQYRRQSEKIGRVVQLHYPTSVYNPELPEYGQEYQKSVRVYLPYGYDEKKEYNVVYTLHGGGGDDYTDWLSENDPNPTWILENLAQSGEAEPCILVFPNGRTDLNQDKSNCKWMSYYSFGPDLRNDLIPFIEEHFSVGKKRENRAVCGLSMGGFQTLSIGIGELFDLFAWLGAFSASFNGGNGMTFSADKAMSVINNSGFDLGYLYMICGTKDPACYETFSRDIARLAKIVPESGKIRQDSNFSYVEAEGGSHNYKVWQYGLYSFLKRIFR